MLGSPHNHKKDLSTVNVEHTRRSARMKKPSPHNWHLRRPDRGSMSLAVKNRTSSVP